MSLKTILRNIFTFLQVLQDSSTEKVLSWDSHTLANALKWADFAEQIFAQSRNKRYCQQLDMEIQKLGQLPWHLDGFRICLSSFQHAKLRLLTKLLENSSLPPLQRQELLGAVRDVDFQSLAELCSELTSARALGDVLTASSVTSPADGTESVETSVRNKIESLSDAHRLYLSLLTSLRQNPRNISVLQEKLKTFASRNDGPTVLTSSLEFAASSVDSDDLGSTATELMVDCLLRLLDTNEEIFWTLSSSVVCNLSCLWSVIFDRYLQYLFRCADSMIPDYDNFVVQNSRYKFSWRLDVNDKRSITYDGLYNRLLQLCSTSCRRVADKTFSEIQTLADLSDGEPNIWIDLFYDVRSAKSGS